MASPDTYGKIIREYEGTGLLTLCDGQTCDCSVRAVQLADGKIIASCLFSENIDLLLACLNKDDAIKSIKGITKENDEFLLEGHILYTNFNHQMTPSGNKISMTVIAQSLKFSKQKSNTFKSVRFGITNLEFFGNKLREYPNGGGAWDILSVNLGDKVIEIHEVQDHKAIMESVKAQRSIDVTCEAVMSISSIDDLDAAIPLIDTLCKLLSFARGMKINWIYYDCYDSDMGRLLSFHKNSIVWQYAGLPLIDPRNPHDTASFVKQSFSAYLSQRDDYGLDIAIETYLDAKRETGYLETRALRAVVVLEFLKSRYAKRGKIEFILRGCHFKKVSRKIRLVLQQEFNSMSLPRNILDEMKSRITELNRKSFRAILEAMFAELGISVTKDELGRFIKIRNSLIHKASFVTTEYWQEYTFLIGTLDRIFSKILNYNGTFLDITNKFNRIDTIQP